MGPGRRDLPIRPTDRGRCPKRPRPWVRNPQPCRLRAGGGRDRPRPCRWFAPHHADLMAKVGWDPGPAVLADLGDVGLWRCGHTTTLGPNLLTVTVTVTVTVIGAAPAISKLVGRKLD